MIGLKKKQSFSLKNILPVDFALPLNVNGSLQNGDIQKRLHALRELGVQQVVLAMEPVTVTEEGYKLMDVPIDTGIFTTLDGLVVEAVPSYWLDDAFEIFIKQHPLIVYRDKYVLLALRNLSSIRGLKGPIFEIRARGYEPVILHKDSKQYNRLTAGAVEYLNDLGCLLQLDLLTLTGVYGAQTKSKAETLISKGWAGMLTTGIRIADDALHLQELMLPTSAISALQQIISQHIQYIRPA